MENEEEPTLNEHFNMELLFILRPVTCIYIIEKLRQLQNSFEMNFEFVKAYFWNRTSCFFSIIHTIIHY